MSALGTTAGHAEPRNSFNASLVLGGDVHAHISAPTIEGLQAIVVKLQGTAAANDTPQVSAPAPAPTGAPAATPAPTSAPAAAAPAAVGSPNFNDVKEKLLALAKKDRKVAEATLAMFGVDKATKLQLEQYPAFIAEAEKQLGAQS